MRITKTTEDGSIYEGDWKNDKDGGRPHGSGTLTLPDGEKIIGKWKKGLQHGKGRMESPNGDFFDGKFKDGVPISGNGKITYADGKLVYEGEFGVGMVLHGSGKLTFEDGMIYEGDFSGTEDTDIVDSMNGHGKMTNPDGSLYFQGKWKDGQPVRQGHSEHRGWDIVGEDGEPGGMMRIVNSETGEQMHMPGIGFHGGDIIAHSEVVDIEIPGTGEVVKGYQLPDYVDMDPGIRDENGKYLGQVKLIDEIKDSSKKVDQAELRLPDMSKYVGEVSGVIPHGTGTLTFNTGSVFVGLKISGKWDNGMLSSGGIYFHKGFVKGDFENGLPKRVTSHSFDGKDKIPEGEIDAIVKELDDEIGEDPLQGLSLVYHWQEWLTNYLSNLSVGYEKSRRMGWIESLPEEDESQILEFKSSIWATYRNDTGELVEGAPKNLKTEDSVVKTIAAFLNTDGGTLVIGIQDRPERRIVGIEGDLPYAGKVKDIESFQNSISELLRNSTGEDSIIGTYVNIEISEISGKRVCLIIAKKRAPEQWTWANVKTVDGGGPIKEAFFVRSGPQTKLLKSPSSAHEWRSSSERMRDEWVFE